MLTRLTEVAMAARGKFVTRKNISPPSRILAATEGLRAVMEAATLLPSLPWLNSQSEGDGHHIYLLPGFLATGASTTVLRAYLDRMGYQTSSWGFGRNLGPREDLAEQIAERITQLSRRTGRPVSIIGQSLGGVFAREVAKAIPEYVRQVITLGSPFGTSPDRSEGTNPTVMRFFEMANGESINETRGRMRDLHTAPPVPCTAIYSKADGIVSWKSCIEAETPLTDNIEIYASHCGMGFNPAVYYILADRLAQPENGWAKFERHGARNWVYPEAAYAS